MPFLLLMPSYNQARYIADAVRSVLAQDDPDWELWIVDNSTDETPAVVRVFSDPRIRFHHIPARMDPGSCLNWMLERAHGDLFSYVHTDNNLHAQYVSRMRSALAGKPHGLAYCDMRTIDAAGAVTGIFQRGAFNLARLFSLEPLGVPFAATTALARALGGFRPADLADDVRFCASAYGLADYVHVAEPLLDYRVHARSRWHESGWPRMRQGFLDLFGELRPELRARGAGDPVAALARAIAQEFAELEQPFEALWNERLSRVMRPWWRDGGIVDPLFLAGFLRLPGFTGAAPKPPLRWLMRAPEGGIAAWPWQVYATAADRARHRPATWRRVERLPTFLVPWAHLAMDGRSRTFCVDRPGFRCLVTAQLLHQELGWEPRLAPGVRFPRWVPWRSGTGDEPRLRFADVPSLAT